MGRGKNIMPVQWKKTKHPGVRYYEHSTRKNGIQKDKYFAIRYQRDGKRIEEGAGWASDGWSAEDAAIELAELKRAHKTGSGPTSLKEKRQIEDDRKKVEEAEKAREERENITFDQYFEDTYYPIAKTDKNPESHRKEDEHFKNWLKPVLGKMPFRKIRPLNLEKVKKNMLDKKKAPRSIQYVFATFRQCWNMAKRDGLVPGESPSKAVKIPKFDNKRYRYLTHAEADGLLVEIQSRSRQLYEITMISLHCGCRASEIFRLRWSDVDMEKGTFNLRDTKNKKTRIAYMTEDIKQIFAEKKTGGRNDLVYTDRNGKKIVKISNAFERAVIKLKLNEGITDRRQKIVFHSCRHTFASWHVEAGTDLYTLKELMGHSTMAITERYAHVQEKALQSAVKNLERGFKKTGGNKVLRIKGN
jgi:integrase